MDRVIKDIWSRVVDGIEFIALEAKHAKLTGIYFFASKMYVLCDFMALYFGLTLVASYSEHKVLYKVTLTRSQGSIIPCISKQMMWDNCHSKSLCWFSVLQSPATEDGFCKHSQYQHCAHSIYSKSYCTLMFFTVTWAALQ